MATYKTPGVYVEEISKLPPSVAHEPTSVAVFIGYTEIVTGKNGDDLKLKPVQCRSLPDYIAAFGETPGERFLYDSVNMFYNNGGGDCYIISVGEFNEPVLLSDLQNGLNSSKEVPAQLLLIPDACLLPEQDFSLLQQKMLQLCSQRQDRFAILDTLIPTDDPENDFQTFRAGIGNYNLKWGAAYYPWLILTDNKPVPPSGAIAGIYAQVDTSRGVWKAPANISLNGINEIAVHINAGQQDNMNVDAGSGKSINAIRFFTGKGFMVWGSRTLAGNDNEWRYVPVRRFFTMVEQSVKKSTGWAVFEPNDANTWVKIEAEIENFLTVLWRSGALAGAKPEHAFYVNIGLNKTMTAVDILEGNLIIEIGLAVVRPAEFIILRFSHKTVAS